MKPNKFKIICNEAINLVYSKHSSTDHAYLSHVVWHYLYSLQEITRWYSMFQAAFVSAC